MAGTLTEEQLARHVYTALQVEEISLTIKIMFFTHPPVSSHFSVDTSKSQLVVLNLESKSEQTVSVFMSHTKPRMTQE